MKRHAHGWNAELRLPLAALEPQPKGDAAGWKTNIYSGRRSAPGGTEYTSVAATFGGHHLPDKFAVLRFGEAGGKEHFVDGSLEGIDAARFAKVFRPGGQGGSTVELATDYAYAGQNSIKATVVPGSLASVTVTSPAEAGKAYRITLAHRNQVASLNPEVRPDAPNTRVICRDATGQAVTPTTGYSWSGTPAQLQPGEWRLHAHTFTAPPGTTQVSFTVFLHHPGEYRLDSFRIEAIE
ncbi:MAG: hypothetical protein HUU35_15115 [Armatimonadetes bacterium]|nr:hypothetical protein [Armatimonadota bacterium]